MRVGRVPDSRVKAAGIAGFTITELLVVMGIIGILAAIVFPVVIKTREGAKVTECLSNMKQIGTGLFLYTGDFNGRFPNSAPWGSPAYWSKMGGQKTIQELLNSYVRNGMHQGPNGLYERPGVLACPSDMGLPGNVSVNGVPPGKVIWKYTGCSYEYYAENQVDWQEYDPKVPKMAQTFSWTGLSPEVMGAGGLERIGAPQSAILSPTRKAVLGDTWYWHMGDQVPDGRLAYRNTLFADFHAARVTGSDHDNARVQPLRPGWHKMHEVPVD